MSVALSLRCPPLTSTCCGPRAWMRRAASSMSVSVATAMSASTEASCRFGVTTSASGSIASTSAARASGCSSGSPDLATMTGSSTSRACPCARSRSATVRMIGAVDSMPSFTASAPKSPSTASSCSATNSGGRLCTPLTPTEFCAVTAVITDIPNTRNAENVLRSAWMPAPPPESEPATVSALGTPIDPPSIRGGPTTHNSPGPPDRCSNDPPLRIFMSINGGALALGRPAVVGPGAPVDGEPSSPLRAQAVASAPPTPLLAADRTPVSGEGGPARAIAGASVRRQASHPRRARPHHGWPPQRQGRALGGRRGNHHRELAAHTGRFETAAMRGRSRPHDLLELLGQLARHDDLAVAEDLADRIQRGQDTVRRLVEHDGRLQLAQRLEAVQATPGLHRREAVEHEAVGRHAGRRQRRHHRRGPWHRHYRDTGRPGLTHQQEPRIRDPGRAGVGHERHRRAVLEPAQDLDPLGELVVLEVRGGRGVDVEVREQRPRAPRVLAGDEAHLAQHPKRPVCDVLEIADRRRDDEQRPRQAVCSFTSETRTGRSWFRMTSRVITHSLRPWMDGSSYMISSMTSSRIARRPRAPVPRLSASRTMAATASSVNLRRTFSRSKYFWYCLMIAFFGSLRMRTSAGSSRSCKVATTGSRPTNSGMRPYLRRSSGWIIASRSPTRRSSRLLISAPKPMPERPTRDSMILSSPTNAPPQMNSTLEVSTWMNSWWGCLRPPCGGTLAMVPSRIFKSACWTPSPETSRVIDGFSALRAILSISSM